MSLDVAWAFAFHSYVTRDLGFLREKAWPILSGVADWIASRVTHSDRGYEIRAAMGIAERETEADNAAFTRWRLWSSCATRSTLPKKAVVQMLEIGARKRSGA